MLSRIFSMVVFGCLTACTAAQVHPPGAASPQAVDSMEQTPASGPDSSEAQGRRMSTRELEALPPVADSVCREHASRAPLSLNRCEFLGPFPGEIAPPSSNARRYALTDALLACHSDIACMGISTDWYTGSLWYAVSTSKAFTPDDNSYGCSFVIACS
ncbi:MAG: hypothetical protein VXW32_02745 [Myxococcota bacterium]|nr:hypothetical protein [Myxococcota bacterium]